MSTDPPPDPFALKFIRFILTVTFLGPFVFVLILALLMYGILILIELYDAFAN